MRSRALERLCRKIVFPARASLFQHQGTSISLNFSITSAAGYRSFKIRVGCRRSPILPWCLTIQYVIAAVRECSIWRPIDRCRFDPPGASSAKDPPMVHPEMDCHRRDGQLSPGERSSGHTFLNSRFHKSLFIEKSKTAQHREQSRHLNKQIADKPVVKCWMVPLTQSSARSAEREQG